MRPVSFCINPGELEPDELMLTDPEPCEFCSTGIRWMYCYDGKWRCRDCVHVEAAKMPPLETPPEPLPVVPVPSVVPAPTHKQLTMET